MRVSIDNKRFLIIILTNLLVAFQGFTQVVDTIQREEERAYGIRILPSFKDHFYGLGIGLVGSESVCKPNNTKHSHGVNLQIFGQGFFVPFNHSVFGYKHALRSDTCWMIKIKDSISYKAVHNGLLISTFGTMTDVSNGLVIGGICSLGYKLNGIAINVLASKYIEAHGITISCNNQSYSTKGIQIGLLNRTNKLKGFQFGLWNVNSKRKLPLINWCFSD